MMSEASSVTSPEPSAVNPEQATGEVVEESKEIKVTALREGTVIDHLTPGTAMRVVQILGIDFERTVTVGLNLESRKGGHKDLIKLESRELRQEEIDKIAVLSPNATFSIIRGYKVVEKKVPVVPDVLDEVIRCANPSCVTSMESRIPTKFHVLRKSPLRVRCHYCERAFREEEIELLG